MHSQSMLTTRPNLSPVHSRDHSLRVARKSGKYPILYHIHTSTRRIRSGGLVTVREERHQANGARTKERDQDTNGDGTTRLHGQMRPLVTSSEARRTRRDLFTSFTINRGLDFVNWHCSFLEDRHRHVLVHRAYERAHRIVPLRYRERNQTAIELDAER